MVLMEMVDVKNKEFLKLIFKRKYKLIIVILLVMIFSATEVFANYSMSFFMNIINVKDKKEFIFMLIKTTIIVIGSNFLWVIVMYIKERYKNILRKDFRNDIKEHIVDKINSLSYQELKSNDSGIFISWLSVDIQQISQSSYGNFFSIVTEFLKYSISIISILYINILSGIISIILSIFMMIFPPFLNKIMETISKDKTIANEKFLSDSKNYISGYDIFVLTNLKKVFKEKILISSEKLENVELKFRAKFIFVHCLRVLVLILPVLIMFIVSGYAVYRNNLPMYQFLGIQQLAIVSFNSLSTLFLEFTEFNTTAPIFDKYIIDKKYENREERLEKLDNILVDDITFSYEDDKYILKNYSAKFEYPNKYFLVGKSGGGKSTLVKLLQGLYKVNSGKIYLNGKDVDNIKIEDIRKNIGYLSQDIYLMQVLEKI